MEPEPARDLAGKLFRLCLMLWAIQSALGQAGKASPTTPAMMAFIIFSPEVTRRQLGQLGIFCPFESPQPNMSVLPVARVEEISFHSRPNPKYRTANGALFSQAQVSEAPPLHPICVLT